MKIFKLALVLAVTALSAAASAQEMTALSCDDFRPTPEALERFSNLKGACEGVVDMDGELYAKFTAIVRRAAGSSVTLYLPATEHTFRVKTDSSQRVLVGGKKTRVRDLVRSQEIRIYLAVSQFAKPDIEEVAFVTEEDYIIDIEIERVPALPTARAETEKMQKPARVTTATVQSMAIVEAVNKETRELKLIDASGKRYTIVADELVHNFDQIEPRDRIVMEYLESVAIFVAPAGAPELGNAAAVELAPLGSKPGISSVETFMTKATVESLNLTDRIATVRYADGSMRTIKVADDVPLNLVTVGDEVRFRITKAVAISVRKANDR